MQHRPIRHRAIALVLLAALLTLFVQDLAPAQVVSQKDLSNCTLTPGCGAKNSVDSAKRQSTLKLPDTPAGIHLAPDQGDLASRGQGAKNTGWSQAACQAGPACYAQAKRAARQRERLQNKIADLFEHRHLFVQHDLTPAELRRLQKITRGLPQLRSLRDLMEEVYRLFDRRCRTDTALSKLAKLRQRVRRFKQVGKILTKLRSPNLDKALTFLDDKLFPSTSNAVERGNRRHRKMQKTVYRVRTREHIHNRIALDMLRDSQRDDRTDTMKTLHCERAKSP
jgi:hypothetical protein